MSVHALHISAQAIVLCFCNRNALAACVYRSAAFSHFSVLPPKRLKPPDAPFSAFEALASKTRGSCDMLIVLDCWEDGRWEECPADEVLIRLPVAGFRELSFAMPARLLYARM